MPTTINHKAAARSNPSPLHDALTSANDAARLAAFAHATGCEPGDLSIDGKSLNVLRVFDAMRRRGYTVSAPVKPQAQPQLRRGLVTWTVVIGIPGAGVTATLAFYEPAQQ